MYKIVKGTKVIVDVTGVIPFGVNHPVVSIEPNGRIPQFPEPVISGKQTATVSSIDTASGKCDIRITKDGFRVFYRVPASSIIDVVSPDIETEY